MKTEEFNFDLPEELIAQHPCDRRSDSRMLVLHKPNGQVEDKKFTDFPSYLRAGDVLVRNNTKVIPARLFGEKEETHAHVEVLLLKQHEKDHWECLVGNAKTIKVGSVVSFGDGALKARCTQVGEKGIRFFQMEYAGRWMELLDHLGNVPLPPYIKEKLSDPSRYQTVYAKVEGSAAAPTAGLHFTDVIFDQLKQKGVLIEEVTLHVGLGTFRPMDTENIEEHVMHSEAYEMLEPCAQALNLAKKEGRRIITIGTTSTRTLEAIYQKYGTFQACRGETDIFIYPGYHWQAVDAILTNFHLPKSTLIMMISSFAGKEPVFRAYQHAIEERYRFFSFGDCMFIDNE